MKEITVTTQAKLDTLPAKFNKHTRIIIKGGTPSDPIIVRMARENSSVEAWGNSSVVAQGNASVEACEKSSVEAWGNSSVVAYENSSVVAKGNASVEAYDNASVKAWENSSVEAWENSSVMACGNSSVEAWGNSSVEAYESSSVVAKGNSSVEAWGNAGVHLQSSFASVSLFGFAVCWVLGNGKVLKQSKTATIIKPKIKKGNDGWLESQSVKKNKNHVVLFKRVSGDLKTQENTPNETTWTIGKTITHPAWTPKNSECGEGKFHACSYPHFCDEFRTHVGDKYIAIRVNVKDLYAWKEPQYPHKIAFRQGTALYQCDKHGKKM
jgi:hypothetical protein